MTTNELVNVVGTMDDANYIKSILLQSVTEPFVASCVRNELRETVNRINELKEVGIIYVANQHHRVDCNPNNDRNLIDEAYELLYKRNRLTALAAKF